MTCNALSSLKKESSTCQKTRKQISLSLSLLACNALSGTEKSSLWHATVPFTQCTRSLLPLSPLSLSSPFTRTPRHRVPYHHTNTTTASYLQQSQSRPHRFTSIPHNHHCSLRVIRPGLARAVHSADYQTWQNMPTTSTSPRLAKPKYMSTCSASCGTSCSQLSSGLLAAFPRETWLVSQSSVPRKPTRSDPVRTSTSHTAAAQVWQPFDGASCEVPARPPSLGLAHFYALLFAFHPSSPRAA